MLFCWLWSSFVEIDVLNEHTLSQASVYVCASLPRGTSYTTSALATFNKVNVFLVSFQQLVFAKCCFGAGTSGLRMGLSNFKSGYELF